MYVNNMKRAVNCDLFYTLMTALVVRGSDPNRVGLELEVVSVWLTDTKHSFHLGKTESILFASKTKAT